MVLLNTAVAQSNNPAQMAYAMNLGVRWSFGLFSRSNGKNIMLISSPKSNQ
jgi:thiazole synthase ThiGH ThiG subunit